MRKFIYGFNEVFDFHMFCGYESFYPLFHGDDQMNDLNTLRRLIE